MIGLPAQAAHFTQLDGSQTEGLLADESRRGDEGGRVAERIPLVDRLAIAVVLGGEDRRTLYLCTNTVLGHDDALKQRAGRIEALQVDVPGAGIP